MRRIKTFISVIMTCALLAGCGNSGGDTTTKPITTETVTETTTQATTETTTEAVTEAPTEATTEKAGGDIKTGKSPIWNRGKDTGSADASPKPTENSQSDYYLHTSKDLMKYYLGGSWRMIPKGQAIIDLEAEPNILKFDNVNNTMIYTRGSDGQYAEFSFSLDDLFQELEETSDLLEINGTGVSESFSPIQDQLIGMTDHFQIVLASVNGWDTLYLRHIGNGDSLFGAEGLGDYNTSCGFWVFNRVDEGDINKNPEMRLGGRIDDVEEGLKIKNSTFYAFRTLDMGGEVHLEHMSVTGVQLNVYGEDEACVCTAYKNTEYPMSAIPYRVVGGMDNSGRFDPGLVRVTTDAKGDVTLIEECAYDIFGYYYQLPFEEDIDPDNQGQYPGGLDDDGKGPDIMDGDGPDGRPEEIFGETDELFLGYWSNPDEAGTGVTITETDPQVGGYYLYFTFYGKGGASGVAYTDEDNAMHLYNGKSMSGDGTFEAYITSEDGLSLDVFISWSDTDLLPEFSTFHYVLSQ